LRHDNAAVQRGAAVALAGLGPDHAAPAVPLLAALARSGRVTDGTRSEALDALAQAGPDGLAALVGLLGADDAELVAAALERLAGLGTDAAAAVPCVLGLLRRGPTAEVRAAAYRALGAVGGAARAAVPLLADGLRDEGAVCRARAAEALLR